MATYEATRFATGRKNGLRVEVNGSLGSAVFDLERLNELELYDAAAPGAEQGFTRILVTEADHPYMAAWWPPGHIIGYEHSFTHQMRDFIEAVAVGKDPEPSFADALQVQQVLDAVEKVQVALTDEVEIACWSRGPAVLVGDAAHATSPTLSEGAAMAFEDAVVLADALTESDSVADALRRYESRRRPRTKWVLDRTRDRDRTRDVAPALRDPLLRGRGDRIFRDHYRLLVDPV